jgi:hypothetical protein
MKPLKILWKPSLLTHLIKLQHIILHMHLTISKITIRQLNGTQRQLRLIPHLLRPTVPLDDYIIFLTSLQMLFLF